jgi:hypothetical protein
MYTVAAVPNVVYAATDPFAGACEANPDSPACNTDGKADPIAGENGALVATVRILSMVAGIVAVIGLIWGGIKYISSGGDSSKVSSAKQAVIASLIGLLIALLATTIVTYVVGKI